MSDLKLPGEFSDLEPYIEWVLPTEAERYAKRLASTVDEMQAFYDAIVPRAEAAIEHCNQYPLNDMPDEAVNLLRMMYSMVMVSFPVELWRQPHIPDSGAAYLDCVVEPVP